MGRPPADPLAGAKPAYVLKTLSPRHIHIAVLVAAGMKDADVAATARVSVATIATAKRSPLFQAEVRRHQVALREAVAEKLADRLRNEALPSIDKMVELREGAKDQRLQGDMAKELLSYTASKAVQKTEHVEERRLVIDADALMPMLQVMAEDDPSIVARFKAAGDLTVDAEFEMFDEGGSALAKIERPSGIVALEDLTAQYEDSEREEADGA